MVLEKKLKILFLARWYPNKTNIQLAVFIQKHAMAVATYCDAALLCCIPSDEFQQQLEIVFSEKENLKEVIVYYKTTSAYFRMLNKLINAFRFHNAHNKGMKMINEKSGKQDITHAYILLRTGVMAWWMKFTKGIPYVVSEQWSGYVTGKFQQRSLLDKVIGKFVIRNSSAVTTVSEFLKNGMLKNKLNGNYHVIPNIIETNIPLKEKSNSDVIRILTVADLVDEIKNISGTIRAVAEVVKENPQIRFDIVGGGHDQNKLERLAQEAGMLNKNIYFHGMKTNKEVYEFLQQCDFVIMNSRFETFSSICAEALSCGKPVIATRCGGPQEFVSDENGILIQPDNQKELTEAIKKMILQYNKYDSKSLKEYTVEKFSSVKVGKKFFEIYTSIVSSQ